MPAPSRFQLRSTALAHGRLGWRESGAAQSGQAALVLLHGIGSGAASWEAQLAHFGAQQQVLAWDAPGYGESDPLPSPTPSALDYAAALAQWLAALGVKELVLVGHSWGALIAAAWAASPSAKLDALVLASPARGYGRTEPAIRQAKWRERVEAIERLGPHGLAASRAAKLCAPGASTEAVERVRASMARVTQRGYVQAAHLLAHGDLLASLRQVGAGPHREVLCGALDAVTPPEACAALAAEAGANFTLIDAAAHACYVEQAAAFNAALSNALTASRGRKG